MSVLIATQPYAAAVGLDASLGDPAQPGNPYGFAATVCRTENDAFPSAIATAGDALRLSYVPQADGGDLTTLDETLALVRVVARRDPAVMPATMMNVTATWCVLIAGTPEQRAEVVRLIRSGASVGFAFSEPDHGSDLLANTCSVTPDPAGGWRLDGDKWLVGLGLRPAAMLLVAHSGGRGPAAYSTLLVDYPAVAASRTGAARPSGMRGIDFARFRFRGVPVPAQAAVGPPGRGMETAMKAMQVVRVLSTAANLAATDSALRLTYGFAGRHVVAGRPVAEHPANRRELGTAAAAMIACDAVAVACTRGMHTHPGSQSVWSGVVKKVVADLSDEAFGRCGTLLGTRSVLRDGPEGAFDVLRADNAVVRYFDTSPMANLRLVAMHLSQPSPAGSDWPADRLVSTFRLSEPLPPLEPGDLQLSARGRDAVAQAAPALFAAVHKGLSGADPLTRRLQRLVRLAEVGLSGLAGEFARALRGDERATAQLDLAERFCYLHAAAACTALWWFNRDTPLYGTPAGSPGWLIAVLALLLDRARCRTARLSPADAAHAYQLIARLHDENRLFSAVPLPLAAPTSTARRSS